MVEIHVEYLGDLRCKATHGPSGVELITDAPLDNHGRGESFSPTDLAATAYATCMLTIMGIVARNHKIDLGKVKARVQKIMSSDPPRRIAKINVLFSIPLPSDHPQRQLLEQSALACPVHHSLGENVERNVSFEWIGSS
ncbi:MAG: OsmC family protein [Chthoniobacterales bacterium]|nr:OsmC family protein [Chthoniobacterales bacterium]